MPIKLEDPNHESAAAWARGYYLASGSVMEAILRPYDLGPTQWQVLYILAEKGPTNQRDLVRTLHIERATLTGVVAALVRKQLVEQLPDPHDQRQKVLRITEAGGSLWRAIPDPNALIRSIAFDDIDEADLVTTIAVLQAATRNLIAYKFKERSSWGGS
ncbi:MAG: MarR family transcriptional regulator [Lacisediminihabitans sp.]